MIVMLGLVVLALLLLAGMIGRSFGARVGKRKDAAIEPARKCDVCGAYALADAPCARADCPLV
jgi:hypothetical protein